MTIKNENEEITYFYKYRPLIDDTKSNGINENTLRLLEYGELYFSKPRQFNDPFDCKINYDTNISSKDILQLFRRKALDEKIIQKKLKDFSENHEKFISLLTNQRQSDYLNILCFSKDEKNILMWSHYAKNHTGICIGLKTYPIEEGYCIKIEKGSIKISQVIGVDDGDLIFPISIEYTNNMPQKYNVGQGNQDILLQFMTRKALCWKYEKESRIIITDQNIIKRTIRIKKTEIGEILFGIKTPDNIKEKIIDIIKKYPDPKPNVYQCVYTEGEYSISKEKIKI